MTAFGDADPDDAYDETDPLIEKLAVLGAVLIALGDEPNKARFLIRLAWVRRKLQDLSGG